MLARAFLRICALEALRPSALLAADTGWPTLAGKYVSDSRIDPIDDDLASDERRPLIAVYTERTHLTKIAQAGPVFYKGVVDLAFEISVVSKFAADGQAEPIIDFADTDAATEAQLDALEDQIFWCLHFSPTGKLFRQMGKLAFDEWVSEPHRSGEEAIKLARRTVRVPVWMREACYEGAPDAVRANLDRLPPALKAIAVQLADSTYLADLALGMARSASQMPVPPPLNSVGFRMVPEAGEGVEMDVISEIKSTLDVKNTIATGAAIEIDYSRGTFQFVTLAANVPAMSVVNWPGPGKTGRLILQITNTGAFDVSGWPPGTVWSGGIAPIITTGAGKRDVVVLTSADGGATVFGSVIGQDYQ